MLILVSVDYPGNLFTPHIANVGITSTVLMPDLQKTMAVEKVAAKPDTSGPASRLRSVIVF